MPLYKTVALPHESLLLVWKITETYHELYDSVELTEESEFRLQGMKSEMHQKGFLAVRKLLQVAGYTDFDMFYENSGKPNLMDDHYISVTHSFVFAAIVISVNRCGIDIELQRDKIKTIQHKFLSEKEFEKITPEYEVRNLTTLWAVKESIYKLIGLPGLSFKNHIFIDSLSEAQGKVTAQVQLPNKTILLEAGFEAVETFMLAYSIQAI